MFNKTCEYGIRACIFIAKQTLKGEVVNVKTISENIDSPVSFTAKVLQILTRNGVVNSVKGINGGFSISKDKIKDLTLQELVEVLEARPVNKICVFGLSECSDKQPCPAHGKYKFIKKDTIKMLQSTRLESMVNDVVEGRAYLKV
jgi:Rrf2 family transcriptional regulator, iron-sulfur cluster assembly transcription factor